jgi:hypothetical protein
MTTLKINEKEHSVDFRLNALRLYCREKNIEFHEFEDYFRSLAIPKHKLTLNDIESLALLALCGFRNGALSEHLICDLTLDDVINWFSEDPMNMVMTIRLYAENKPQAPKDGGKKKN